MSIAKFNKGGTVLEIATGRPYLIKNVRYSESESVWFYECSDDWIFTESKLESAPSNFMDVYLGSWTAFPYQWAQWITESILVPLSEHCQYFRADASVDGQDVETVCGNVYWRKMECDRIEIMATDDNEQIALIGSGKLFSEARESLLSIFK